MQIFVSYKREDEPFARQLYAAIQSWGYDAWLDVACIPPGANWDDAIHAGLKASEVVIGVLTPESLSSPNVRDEWGYALSTKKRLFLLWLRDVPEDDILPRYIRIQRVDCRYDRAQGLEILRAALASPVKILVNEPIGPADPAPWPDLPSRPPDRNRERMLHKVRAFWIEGVLEKSLHGATLIELGIERKPGAVENPWDSVLQHRDYGDYKLPGGTKIGEIFHALNGELLILGEPGSGKTTTLLELARDLIDGALRDETQPMPVVFNLSSWADERLPLGDWLVDELNSKYQVPKKVARSWVEADQLLLLLDGLDEVDPERRNACVEVINRFRAEHMIDLVVCSRTAEYELLSSKLRLQGAVILLPLTPAQIDQYLGNFGDELAAVRRLLHQDETLREMVRSPLLLNILTLAYRGMSAESFQTLDTVAGRRRHLFQAYVKRMFERKGLDKRYSPEQTIAWLARLARMMVRHSETVFFIERMQPDWLSRRSQTLLYLAAVRLAFGMVCGAAVGVIAGVVFGLAGGPGLGIRAGLGIGAATGVIFMFLWGWSGGSSLGVVGGLVFGLTVGLVAGLNLGWQQGWLWAAAYGLLFSLAGSFIFGIIGGLLAILAGRRIEYRERISVVDSFTWSWSEAGLGFVVGLIVGAVGGTLAGLVFGLESGWLFGLLIGGACGLALVPLFGLTGSEIEIRTVPNEGIWRSFRNALRFGLAFGVVMGVIAGLAGGIPLGLVVGLIFATAGFGSFGGIPFSQHVILRLLLYLYRDLPWNYARFLDYCTERVLLRKVGGGYIFVHRLLLDYFAGLETEA